MDKPVLVIINGRGGSGKDTFVKYCVDVSSKLDLQLNVVNYSTITPCKDIFDIVAGIDDSKGLQNKAVNKTDEYRKCLHDLKTYLNAMTPFSITHLISKFILAITSSDELDRSLLFFCHCREPEFIDEIKELVANIKIITILIKRDTTDRKFYNEADDNVDNYNYDAVYVNNGSEEELYEKAKEFVTKLFSI